MAGLIVLKPGVDWIATGGLFDWTLEFLISRLSDRQTTNRLQEIVDNNLGSLWIDDLPAAVRQEIVSHWRNGLVTAASNNCRRPITSSRKRKDDQLALHDVVELREARPSEQLSAGAVGTVVDVFEGPPPIYEVEFTDADGRTLAMVTLRADQVVRRDGNL
ncbi:DUF4926 domain-containing protein [Micromonospora sp. CPCC 205558]|uniref:DUF4926 domain-containing protein n=1 Tax=Micromonospora sp. CPCC 205558 TaxID=3122403 RepID=UPI002FEEDAC1